MDSSYFDRLLADAALEMARRPSTPTTVERAVLLAHETVEACDAAALTLFVDDRPATVAASEETVREVVEAQFLLGAGPTLFAYTSREAVYSPDLRADHRWSEFGVRMADQLGLSSAYAVPLAVHVKPLGVLSLYGKKIDAFGEDDIETADVVASHAAVAVADSIGHDHLETALASRTVIGQATGIVMERWGLAAPAAFGVLRRLSQDQNVKIRDIAVRIVETGSVA
jgi:GAF domain-containing protein